MAIHEERLLTASRFHVQKVSYLARDGQKRVREVVRHPGAVTIIPLVDEQHVCLIRNYRVAVAQTLIELPAGTLEPDEDPLRTAERELVEETGYRAGEMLPLHEFYLSPGILDERMHLFLATGLTAGATAREPGEEIENLVVAWGDALRMIDSHEIQDAKTIVGLLYYERYRRR